NTPLNGVILVSIDSDISSIEQLKGKVVSSPPEVSALAHLTNMALSEKGINAKKDVTRIYAKNHFACMQAVLLGKAQACGTAKRAMAQFEDKEMSKRFKIIAQTPKIPHSLFVVHSRVSKDEREMLKNRIITWEKTATGKQILERSNLVPFVEAHDKEYNVVRNYLKTN
ncbi:MAG: phosphate/phosphite/phosphonate ABC transporter substrate-binding protein, partial [Gammaproteobacteria bacterium]|nr:phosphate/phosphite/phosphonate ABC transporter substrate-binding protein [Gammaproteobacteria bacterium]